MDQCKTPITFCLDLLKAFDTLDTEILIQKLKYYGVMDTSLKWFESYLTNRKQYVEYNNTKSTIKNNDILRYKYCIIISTYWPL